MVLTLPPRHQTSPRRLGTFDQLLDRFLKDARPPSAKWGGEVERIFNKDVRPAIGSYKIEKVSRGDILAILNSVKDRSKKGIAANRTQAALRRAFSWAVGEGYLTANPALGIAPRAREEA